MLSEDKISHVSHIILDRIWNDDLIDYENEGFALKITKQIITDFVKQYEDVDGFVRKKISSQKKEIPEGSRDWTILYRKYYNEEINKRKL